jgi:hypothetical protein
LYSDDDDDDNNNKLDMCMPYIKLRVRWNDITVLKCIPQMRIKAMKQMIFFQETIQYEFDQVPNESTVRRFQCKSRKRNILKLTIRNEILYEISNNNTITAVNSATSENLYVNNTMFPYHNNHK